MRTTLLALMVALPAAALVNAAWCSAALAAFAREIRTLASTADLERFKRVVAHQMYAALIQIALLGAPPILFAIGVFSHALGFADVVYILVPAAVIIVVGLAAKRLETRVRTIPTPDDELRRQRDAIVATWVKKPLPDW